jgi:hypothetical protein
LNDDGTATNDVGFSGMLRIGVLASHEGMTRPVRRYISWTPSTTPARSCVRSASGSLPENTVESLKARVQAFERDAVVRMLAAIASGELVLGSVG